MLAGMPIQRTPSYTHQMMDASALKMLLLSFAAILSHRVYSPPTPPAKQTSISKFGKGDEIGPLVRWIPIVGQVSTMQAVTLSFIPNFMD